MCHCSSSFGVLLIADPEMQEKIEKILLTRHASFEVSLFVCQLVIYMEIRLLLVAMFAITVKVLI